MTTLKCGEYRCTKTNSPVENFEDDRGYEERSKNAPPKATLRNVRCNFHAGVLRRAKYRRDPLPLSPKDIERLLKEQAAKDEAEREEQRLQAIEAEKRNVQRHAEDWAYMDVEAHHSVVMDEDRMGVSGEPIFEGHVWTGEKNERERRYGEYRWFNVEPTHRYYGEAKPGARLYPYTVRVTRGSSLSPNEARALAAALIEGADRAEELNAERKPKTRKDILDDLTRHGEEMGLA